MTGKGQNTIDSLWYWLYVKIFTLFSTSPKSKTKEVQNSILWELLVKQTHGRLFYVWHMAMILGVCSFTV